jgi:hypothetical protein
MLNRLYYYIRPILPRSLQIFLRRQVIYHRRRLSRDIWPIDPGAGTPPDGWPGWPDHKQFALVLQHDVDTLKGHNRCYQLMALEQDLGFRSSFNFVPERYKVEPKLRERLAAEGFEVGVHGLKHDGRLFASRRIFQERAIRINRYLKEWNTSGFSSPSMHHNLDWMHDLKITHATTTFDTDPFEPQPDGVSTIFPFTVYKKPAHDPARPVKSRQNSEANLTGASSPPRFPASRLSGFPASPRPSFFIELPYTLPQDFTLFIILREKNIDIWKHKLDWIARKGGMVLLNSHPDYMNFNGGKLGREEYPAQYYAELLTYVKEKYEAKYWNVLPSRIARFWSTLPGTAQV